MSDSAQMGRVQVTLSSSCKALARENSHVIITNCADLNINIEEQETMMSHCSNKRASISAVRQNVLPQTVVIVITQEKSYLREEK